MFTFMVPFILRLLSPPSNPLTHTYNAQIMNQRGDEGEGLFLSLPTKF